jgi:hypothetical protein
MLNGDLDCGKQKDLSRDKQAMVSANVQTAENLAGLKKSSS